MRRDVSYSLVANFAPPAAGLIVAPLLARGMGLGERGSFAAANAVFLLGSSALTLGLPEAAAYFYAREAGSRRVLVSLVALTLLLGCLAGAAVFALAGSLSAGDAAAEGALTAVAVSLPGTLAVGLLRGRAQGLGNFAQIAAERISSAVLRVVTTSILAVSGTLTPFTGVIALAASTVLPGVVYLRRNPKGERVTTATPASLGEFVTFGGRIWLGAVAGVLLSRLDQSVMLPIVGKGQLALYAVAATVADAVLVINAALAAVQYRHQAARPDADELLRYVRMSSLVTLGMSLIVATLAMFGLAIVFGAPYSGAYTPLLILLVSAILGNPGSIAATGLSAQGRPGLRSLSVLIGLVVNVTLIVPLGVIAGGTGVATATLVGVVATGLFSVIMCSRVYRVPAWRFYTVTPGDVRYLYQAAILGWLRPIKHKDAS